MEENEKLCELLLVSETTRKVERILRQILEPNFQIKNDLYLNLLLTQWASKTENGALVNPNPELNDLFFQWIVAASNLWNAKKVIPSTPVLVFALHVCCHLNTDEAFFIRMNTKNVFRKLAEVSQANPDSDVTVGFMTLLSSVLEYAIGVEWLLTTTYWNDIINIALRGRTKYIKKKAYQFIIKLLETTALLDQEFCKELVEILIEPLSETAERSFTTNLEEKNKELYESLKPWLDLISEVADTLLKKFNKNVLNIFFESEIPEAIQNILNCSQIEDFSFDLLKIRLAFLFYQLYVKLEGNQQLTHDKDTLSDIKTIFELIQAEIEKDHNTGVIKICQYAYILYYNLDTHIPICIRKGESIEFQNQMIVFLLVPATTFSCQLIGTQKAKNLLLTDEVRQDYFLKFAKMSAIKTLDLTSRWQQQLTSNGELINYISLSLQYITKLKKILNKEQAAFIFRPLAHILNDMLWRLENYQEINMPPRGIRFFNIITDTIIDLVESFDLTWKDSIETISMLDLVCAMVRYDYVDYQLTVKFLQLFNMAISRCMSPTMVLLLDNTNDSAMNQGGTILYAKCHNNSHQIRTNALKVVRTIAVNANTKFPEFINLLCNADLPKLVMKMAIYDKESEVRVTAIECIQALILIEDIWAVYQSDNSFWDNILNILVNEPKGTVRKEAVNLIYAIYNEYEFPQELLSRLYDVMTHAAVDDIHWEVKCNAINFWACTLKNLLKVQGMIDRGFPTHTFSKEKKKIITLTEIEIRKRVIRVLNQLSEIGCLYVLKTTLQDKFDDEVSKKAMDLTKNVIRMLKAHKITCDNIELSHPPSPAGSFAQHSSSSSKSSENKFSPDRRFSLESSHSQCLDSPFSSLSSPESISHEDTDLPDNNTALIRPDDKVKQNTKLWSSDNISSSNDSQKPFMPKEELENFDFFTTEKDLLILENDVDIGVILAENITEFPICDIAETEKMFDELLKLNDATLLEEIYNPVYQAKTSPTLKTKEYLPAAEYVRFCYEVDELNQKNLSVSKKNLDEFDSLLDDVLKEYDITAIT